MCTGFEGEAFWVPLGPQAPFEVQQVPPLPLYTPQLVLFPNRFSFFLASLPPELQIFGLFFGHRLGRNEKGFFPPTPSFLSCVLSAQDPSQPIYTTNFPPSLPEPTKLCTLH